MNTEIVNLVKAAVECSVFFSPTDPGLSYQEILEVGKRLGFLEGEVADAAIQAGEPAGRHRRFIPDAITRHSWVFLEREDPDYRNFEALDFVFSELNMRVRNDGKANAQVERSLVVERALAANIARNDIEAAITYHAFSGQIIDKDGVLRFTHNSGVHQLPSVTLEQLSRGHRNTTRKPARLRVFPIVKDIIERRTDSRPIAIEPLDAFAEQLNKLGYGAFRIWWTQVVTELRRSDVQTAYLSTLVLAAALVEGALTFIVKHAQTLGAFQSSDFNKDPRTWKIDDLVTSAARGGDSAILDLQTRSRAESLIRSRQRIHAGRMVSEFPAGVPDIRPEEARDAKATADQVARCVLDWLQKFPPR